MTTATSSDQRRDLYTRLTEHVAARPWLKPWTSGSPAGHEVERAIPLPKAYTVFNVAQIENLPAPSLPQPEPPTDKVERIALAEAFITAIRAPSAMAETAPATARSSRSIQLRCPRRSRTPTATPRPRRTS